MSTATLKSYFVPFLFLQCFRSGTDLISLFTVVDSLQKCDEGGCVVSNGIGMKFATIIVLQVPECLNGWGKYASADGVGLMV